MLTREEYINIMEASHNELMHDICTVHGISIHPFDRSKYDCMSDIEIGNEILAYEESLKSDHMKADDYIPDNGSWGDVRVGDYVYVRAEMGSECSSGWRYDPPHGMGW